MSFRNSLIGFFIICGVFALFPNSSMGASLQQNNLTPQLLPSNPSSASVNTSDTVATHSSGSLKETIPLRALSKTGGNITAPGGKVEIETVDPQSGKIIHIDISSDTLGYDSKSSIYTATGNVYIIIPERKTEILADKATYDPNLSNMDVTGNVFIINKKKVLSADDAEFDLNAGVSNYVNQKTILSNLRIRSDYAQRTDYYLVMRYGRVIVGAAAIEHYSRRYRNVGGFHFGTGYGYTLISANRWRTLMAGQGQGLYYDLNSGSPYPFPNETHNDVDKQFNSILVPAPPIDKPVSPRDIINADYSDDNVNYQFKSKVVNIQRHQDGFDDIELKNIQIRFGDRTVGYFPSAKFGYDENNKYLAYLGPQYGYDIDYGGFYYGPAFSNRLLNGWLHYGPIVTYGGGTRLNSKAGETSVAPTQVDGGFAGQYLSDFNQTSFAYSLNMREPLFLMQQRLFDGQHTRIRLSSDEYMNNGFFGAERPKAMAEILDQRNFHPFKFLFLRTDLSAGVAKDNFDPARISHYFVNATSETPITTTRLQIQTQLSKTTPLIYLGNHGSINVLTQEKATYYGTGQTYGVMQSGPTMTFVGGPFFSNLTYLYGRTTGSSPFVFDTFYNGRNSLSMTNAVDLGKYVTVGFSQVMSLSRDNASNSLVLGQVFFVSFGSKNLKFAVSYDTIQKRGFFGFTLNPEGGQSLLDFNTMNIFQPGFKVRNGLPDSLLNPGHHKKANAQSTDDTDQPPLPPAPQQID